MVLENKALPDNEMAYSVVFRILEASWIIAIIHNRMFPLCPVLLMAEVAYKYIRLSTYHRRLLSC